MFLLVKKLKAVKGELKRLNRERFGDIVAQEAKAYLVFQALQDALHADPSNEDIANRERKAQTEYLRAHKTYMQFLAQKAKSEWRKEGDENTGFFHETIKQRHIQNSIFSIKHMHGNWSIEPAQVPKVFLEYYCNSPDIPDQLTKG